MTPAATPTITLTGPSGDYRIQRAQVLGNPTNWVTIRNVTLTAFPFTFYVATEGSSQQFYQAVQQQTPDNPNPTKLVWIPPGSFLMGSPLPEIDRFNDEAPQTWVTFSQGFWIGKYEVTQKEYQAVIGINRSYFTGDLNRPVESVSWTEATNYCGKLTEWEREAGRLPVGYLYRLPTEAEWEYACRAGTTTRFSYGDDLNYVSLGNYAWFEANSWCSTKPNGSSFALSGKYYTTHPVGQKLPNPWGLYDMYGNVWELCLDWYDKYHGGGVTDPKGSNSGLYRVVRGSGWGYNGGDCRSANRFINSPGAGSLNIGFRVVLAQGQ